MKPAVSVIVASRNYGRFLGGALRSILAQTMTDLEVIIIDDGSTDHTPEVVRPFLDDARVHYHRTNGLGQSRAKNLGIMNAQGDWIAFLDGDDEWLPTKLETQLPLFSQPKVGVVYARRQLMDEAGQDRPTSVGPLYRGNLFETLLEQNPICFSSVVVRREVFEQVGYFNTSLSLAIDYDLWLRVARHFEFDYVDSIEVRYRTGHANLSSRIRERIATVLSILHHHLNETPHHASRRAVGNAWGSTYRTLAFVQREQEPWNALKCYARAARHDGRWSESVKAMVGTLSRRFIAGFKMG
jgi:glycosyltransferase involved in cell wall biosynthesis